MWWWATASSVQRILFLGNLTFPSGLKSFDISDFFWLLEKMCSCILDGLENLYFFIRAKKFSAFVGRQDRERHMGWAKIHPILQSLFRVILWVGSRWGITSLSIQNCGISDKDGKNGVALNATTCILITIQTKLTVTGLCGTSVFCWKLVYASAVLHKKIHSPAALSNLSLTITDMVV